MLLLLCLALYLPGLSTIPPVDRDEAYFAQATRQMLASGDFIRPRYLDQQRYRKPIGIYWLQAAAVKAVGGADAGVIWPYRLPSAAGMTVAVLLTYWIGALIFDRAVGTLAGALLAASVLAVLQANLARADAVLLACIVAAQACLAALYTGVQPRRRGGFLAAGFWAALGAGILIKGPVAPFVSGSTILVLALTDRVGAQSAADSGQKSTWLADLHWLPGILLAIAMITPWGLSVGRATGWQFYSAASQDVLPKLRAGVESHWGLPGYYLILALVTFYPGSLVLLTAAQSAWRRWTSSPAQRFCLAWLLPTWIACEFIPTKLPHYVLPVYPAVALLIAQALCAWKGAMPGWRERVQAVLWMIITVALVLALPVAATLLRERIGPAVVLWTILSLATAAVCGTLAWKGRLTQALWLSVFAVVLSFASLKLWILPGFDNLYLSRKASIAIASRGIGAVAAVGYQEPSLVFDLWPHIILTDAASAVRFINAPGRRAVLISDDVEPEFVARSEASAQLHRVWIGHGFNYTKGRWTTLTLYEKLNGISGQ